MAEYPGVHLPVAGCELLNSTFTLVGHRAAEFLENLRVDWAFLGADAIDETAGITNANTIEVPVKRALITAGRTVVVLAESTKFDQHALVPVARRDEIDHVITDDGLSVEQAQRCGKRVTRATLPGSTALAAATRVGGAPS